MEDILPLILAQLSAWDTFACLFLNKDFYRAANRRFATATWDYKISGNCNVIFKSGHYICHAEQKTRKENHAKTYYDSFECYGNTLAWLDGKIWRFSSATYYTPNRFECSFTFGTFAVESIEVYSSDVGAEIKYETQPDETQYVSICAGRSFRPINSAAMSYLPRLSLMNGILFDSDQKPSPMNKLISDTFYAV